MSRLRYLLVAALACATVGVGGEAVLLDRAYRSPEPFEVFPFPLRGPLPASPDPRLATAKPGSPQAHAEAIVWQAMVALNQYASKRDWSYKNATTARIRQIDSRLDRSARVVDAAPASYCVEARIKGGQASATLPGYFIDRHLCASPSS